MLNPTAITGARAVSCGILTTLLEIDAQEVLMVLTVRFQLRPINLEADLVNRFAETLQNRSRR
jgi:hypothetical protein